MNRYENYATVLIKKGVDLQPGQKLYIYAPIEGHAFIQTLVQVAYQNQAAFVEVEYYDPALSNIRAEYSNEEYLDTYPEYLINKKIAMLDDKVALLRFSPGMTPEVNNKEKETKMHKGMIKATQPYTKKTRSANLINSCSTVMPTKYWAKQVFPELDEEAALAKLWDNLLTIGKTDCNDPVKEWTEHVNNIVKRRTFLNEKQFKKLKITSNKTDVEIKLCDKHVWAGGCEESVDGYLSMPNFPTEEIFTTMQKDGINGHVGSTKPLLYENQIIDDFVLTFENGKIVKGEAKVGQEYLDNLLNFEEGTRYCGEIALLAGETVISRTNTVYKNTLLDENAACHMAIGCAYLSNLQTPITHCKEDFDKMNINFATVHYDYMFGDASTTVVAYDENDQPFTLLLEGQWQI